MNGRSKLSCIFYKLIISVILFGTLITGIIGISGCFDFNNTSNSDGNGKLLSRSANYYDVTISQSSEFALSEIFKLVPNTDISDLEVTIIFSDSSKKIVTTKTKVIGNVSANVEYSFSFSLTEFSFSEIFNISYWRYEVTGGTVSYFG